MSNPLGFVQANLLQLADTLDDFGRLHDAALALRSELNEANAPKPEVIAAFDGALAAVQPEQALKDSDAAVRESLEGARRIRSSLYDLQGLLGVRSSGESPELAEVVKGAIHALRGVTAPGLVVETELVPDIRASGSASVLRRIIVTLLLRAAEAVAEAGEGRAASVRVYAGRRGAEICLSIADTGAPLRTEERTALLRSSPHEASVLAEFGLARAARELRELGGTLELDSGGSGTRIELRLPAAPSV